ncbi:lipase lipl-4-like [Panonychus citri]|uniref:lipase lipl-4-like n=1 Tax=Panonychus citri TaxID=50023 RepID=UPI0023074A93|nr:lipase lipl-4-like [Panonychus citri]
MKLIKFSNVLIVFILIQLTNCLDLDEVDKGDIPQIIEARGFICEPHYITTSDGYILGNFRIVNPLVSKSSSPFYNKPLKPIIIQSGFLGSAADFIINSPKGFVDQSILDKYNQLDLVDFDLDGRNLGFILANLGYDVWLTNPRGNYYSTNHSKLN